MGEGVGFALRKKEGVNAGTLLDRDSIRRILQVGSTGSTLVRAVPFRQYGEVLVAIWERPAVAVGETVPVAPRGVARLHASKQRLRTLVSKRMLDVLEVVHVLVYENGLVFCVTVEVNAGTTHRISPVIILGHVMDHDAGLPAL